MNCRKTNCSPCPDCERALAILLAFTSRTERWSLVETELWSSGRPIKAWRLTMDGSVVLDEQHARVFKVVG